MIKDETRIKDNCLTEYNTRGNIDGRCRRSQFADDRAQPSDTLLDTYRLITTDFSSATYQMSINISLVSYYPQLIQDRRRIL